jgi:heavy metal sensor kinase
MNHRSLPFRLGVWYTLLLSVTFLCVGAGAFYGLQHYLRLDLRDALKRRSALAEQIMTAAPSGADQSLLAAQIETRLTPEINSRFVRVTRSDGTLVYASGVPADLSFDPHAVPRDPVHVGLGGENTRIDDPLHLMIRTEQLRTPSGDYSLEVGTSTAPMELTLEHLASFLLLLLPILIVCAAAGGYLLVSRALRPVDQLSQTADQLSLQDVTLRLPTLRSGDALERLSIALNNMLERLGRSVQNSQRFLADASHELRTPLTVIKGELQELLRASGGMAPEVRDRVGSVLEEVDRLEHLVSGSLSLSRLDAGEATREWVEVDLPALARATAEQMRLMAEDRGIHIGVETPTATSIGGDPARLKQIIVNLLDNAIRFTSTGGSVTVRVTGGAEGSLLQVVDTGSGIPEAALPRVFDRFYRVDEARSRENGGAGLGLSIVQAICTAHGARIEAESRAGEGSCFTVRFPPLRLARPVAAPVDPPLKS